ncbi:4141_t:CDS:2 [Acaulospora morrowiae]|uniref:4141_t:CDS:1 n=1 Tax=Acaulospora morrowiae TaxID=94023 RepID=A0A9N9F8R1_9GLOM|nr:4141_t:CDS:2 [Acaulospora morrowiae]
MGLPMYVSPSLPKRQLPKQPQSPYEDTDYSGDLYQNSRTSAFGNRRYFIRRPYRSGEYASTGGGVNRDGSYHSSEINLTDREQISEFSDWLQPRTSSSQLPIQNEQLRPQRIRRSSSLPYNNLVQHIQRLGNIPHLHRTREQQIASSGLATRRGMQLQSAQLLHIAQLQAQQNSSNTSTSNSEIRQSDSPEGTNNSTPNNLSIANSHSTELSSDNTSSVNSSVTNPSQSQSNVALDNVFRRVNILRQFTQDNRAMREELIQRGIDIPPLIRVTGPYIPSAFSEIPESLPPLPRRLRHNVRRGNVITSYDSRSNFGEDANDNYDNYFNPLLYDDHEGSAERGHTSRILSPIPRRYDPRYTAPFAVVSPNGMLVENRERIDVDSGTNSNDISRREIQEGSTSGEVC